jgi:2-keto-4-pentenoate hydratase/2-oxohepta-3-ene-1,7-dioic acid hydratase in catechol pathway
MPASAVRYLDPSGEERIGALEGEAVRDVGPAGPRGFVPSPEGWAAIDAASGPVHTLRSVRILPPVAPSKVICIGLNYRDHAEESKLEIPDVPVVFTKHPSCLVGQGESIVLPHEETRPDYEGELAIVIGERCRRVSLGDALGVVGGYTAFNDVSGRRAQFDTPLRQFTYGKSFDTFGPIGPAIVRSRGADLGALDVTTVVSGEVMQQSSTRNLIFGVAELVEYVTRATTLEAGDVIATGTPGGVGDGRTPKRYLRPGDVVEITIGGVPTLRNPVVAED